MPRALRGCCQFGFIGSKGEPRLEKLGGGRRSRSGSSRCTYAATSSSARITLIPRRGNHSFTTSAIISASAQNLEKPSARKSDGAPFDLRVRMFLRGEAPELFRYAGPLISCSPTEESERGAGKQAIE